MPTALPAPDRRPWTSQQALLVRVALWLGIILTLPIISVFALEGLLRARCTTIPVASGLLDNHIAWRIERRECKGAPEPFHDVLIGLAGKTASPALLARGAPAPANVIMADGVPAVVLTGPLSGSGKPDVIPLKLRKSGSPAVRIDLEQMRQNAPEKSGVKF